MTSNILVTGGAGFIGSNFVLGWIRQSEGRVVNLDALTYAGNLTNLRSLENDRSQEFVKGSINDRELLRTLLRKHQPWAIVHLAAESHVDRSILGPEAFIQTNVLGTFALLEEAKQYWENLSHLERGRFRFLHVSTDEVYGSLDPSEKAFSETTPYSP